MTAADLATAADVHALALEVRELRAMVAALADRLPTTWIALAEAAKRLGCDARTVTAAIKRGEVIGRRVGRRWVVDASSLRPVDPATIAILARQARTDGQVIRSAREADDRF